MALRSIGRGSSPAYRVILILALFVAFAAPASGAADQVSESPLDPARYLRLTWNGTEIHKPGATIQEWEVIGGQGSLGIEFDLETMKKVWTFESQGALSIRGYVVSGDGRRPIEVPGYSVIGKDLQVRQLDLAVAFRLVAQLIQGSRLAHRIEAYASNAQLAGLKAEAGALEKLLVAEHELIDETERALEAIYVQALRFRLSDNDVLQAAQTIAAARTRRDRLADVESIGRQAEIDAFFDGIADQRASIDAWLKILTDTDNEPYLTILGPIADRDPELILANATQVQSLMKTLDSEKLTEAGRVAMKRRLVTIAETLIQIENDILVRYRRGDEVRQRIEAAPQFVATRPRGFDFDDVRPFSVIIGEAAEKLPSTACPNGALHRAPGSNAKEIEELTQRRVRALRNLLNDLTGTNRFRQVEDEMRLEFQHQVEGWIEAREHTARRLAAKRNALADRRRAACLVEAAEALADETMKVQAEFIKLALMTDVTQGLIESIVPTTIQLDGLDLDRGDRLEIVVSLLPGSAGSPPPPQYTAAYQVTAWSWSGPAPRISDTLTFVRPKDGGGSYAPRPGTAALWHYHGKARKRNSFLRALSPGFGVEALFLDFDGDEETIEVGIGVTATLFDDLLHVTYGQNLQRRAQVDGDDETRDYFGVGVSLLKVVEKFKSDND